MKFDIKFCMHIRNKNVLHEHEIVCAVIKPSMKNDHTTRDFTIAIYFFAVRLAVEAAIRVWSSHTRLLFGRLNAAVGCWVRTTFVGLLL